MQDKKPLIRKLFILNVNLQHRVYGLDILRALAILFVLFDHANTFLPVKFRSFGSYFFLDGVTLFFVLSGFLIGGILIRLMEEQRPLNFAALKSFWIRRWFRTLPNYFLLLIILLFLHSFFFGDMSLPNAKRYFIFSQNLFYPHPGFFAEAWSLSVEEWFYLLIPPFIFICSNLFGLRRKNAVAIVALVVLILITYIRFYKFGHLNANDLTVEAWDANFRKEVFTRLDSLMFGVLGAYIAHYYRSLWLAYRKPFLLIGIFLLYFGNFFRESHIGLYTFVFSFSVSSAGALCLLPFLSGVVTGKGMLYKVFTFISIISYSMYLLNYTIVRNDILDHVHLTFLHGIAWNIVMYGLFWFLSIMMSILLFKFFELPFTNLRERFKTPETITSLSPAAR